MSDEVVGGLAYEIGTLNPYDATTAGAVAVLQHVHDPLGTRGVQTAGLPQGGLVAAPIEQVGRAAYVLTIRPDALFSDGTKVTAGDVTASIRTMLDASGNKGQLLAGALHRIHDVSVIGDRTVRLDTEDSMPMLGERLSLVRVIPEEWQARGDKSMAPGTGPYRIVDAGRGEALLEPVEHYVGASNRSLIRLVSAVDPSTRLDGLLEGRFQAIEEAPEATESLLRTSDDLTFARVHGQNVLWLMFNCADTRLRDVRVRRALSHALDADELSLRANGGHLIPADSLLPSWHPDHASPGSFPHSSPARARELLAEAGFGTGFELRLAVSNASWVELNGRIVVEQLARIGVEASVTVAHTADLFSKEIPEGNFDLLLSSGDPTVYGSDGEFLLRWYLSGVWARGYCHWSGPAVEEIERLLDLASVMDAPGKRAVLAVVQDMCASHVPMMPIGHRPQPTAWSRCLAGFTPSPTTGLDLRSPFA